MDHALRRRVVIHLHQRHSTDQSRIHLLKLVDFCHFRRKSKMPLIVQLYCLTDIVPEYTTSIFRVHIEIFPCDELVVYPQYRYIILSKNSSAAVLGRVDDASAPSSLAPAQLTASNWAQVEGDATETVFLLHLPCQFPSKGVAICPYSKLWRFENGPQNQHGSYKSKKFSAHCVIQHWFGWKQNN